METMKEYVKKYFLLSLFCALLIVSACKKDDDETPPDLPPKSSFVFDMSNFPTETKAAEVFELTKINFRYAYVQVVGWQIFITAGMYIPVISFVEAFNHTPVKKAPGWWIWSYSFMANDVTYTASLNGQIIGSKVKP